jgi:hypothetical protein
MIQVCTHPGTIPVHLKYFDAEGTVRSDSGRMSSGMSMTWLPMPVLLA